jgi:hypothetical protein
MLSSRSQTVDGANGAMTSSHNPPAIFRRAMPRWIKSCESAESSEG